MNTSVLLYIKKVQCERNWTQMFHSNGGIFYGDISIVRVLPFNMFRLSLFFIVSQSLNRIFKPFKQPEFVSKALAGIILGPSVLGTCIKKYGEILNIASQISVVSALGYYAFLYHVFIISVKTDFAMILKIKKQHWIMGIISMLSQFIIMSILMNILKPLSFKSPLAAHVLTFQISSTWFISLVPLLEQYNLLTTELGQLSITLSLTNELIMWSNVVFVTLLKTFGSNITKTILPLVAIVALLFGVIRPMMLAVLKKLPRGQSVTDIYIVGTFLGGGVMAFICDALIGSPLIGTILIGLAIPHGPPLGLAIVERGDVFIRNCLLPMFFLAVGDSISLNVLNSKAQLFYMLIILVGHITKTMATMFCAMWYNVTPGQGFALGLIMNTSGVIHIMVYWSQLMRQRVNKYISSELVICSLVVTSIVTPLAIYSHKQSKKEHQSVRGFQLSVQSALMSSRMQILICTDNEEDIPGFINFLKASNPTNSNPIHVYLVHFIELVGQAAPMLLPHKKHSRICNYNGCIHIVNTVNTYCNASEGGVSIQLLTMIAPFTSIYETLCKIADDKMIPLIIVPFYYKTLGNFGNNASSQLNLKLQQQTPCTIGVFVNKDTGNKQLNHSYFSYNVVVIFCGGEDDREALTYANRMSTHPGVKITLIKIFVQEYDVIKNENEIVLDSSFVDDFKDMIVNNSCMKYKEFHVEEWLQTLDVVQTLEKDYDLVMLGRRHGHKKAILEDDLYVLSENPELGEIGELIVSGELKWENTSFLVMQHCLSLEKETFSNVVLLDDS
ncbi:cation/H(+) antiporter 15-like [Silene latifolia]|uniref:cation/H(+) antiporter 15-like n=1 Tax=Silene latifolia TaxID=37657 RepID=UPI003D76A6E5